MKKILFYFRKEKYGWLSNFERVIQIVDGKIYPTNEHYYQAQKAKDPKVQEWIRKAPSAWLAMMVGRSLRDKEMVENWEEKKLDVMLVGLRVKFKDKNLAKKLLETKPCSLHENSPTDMFWGIKGEDYLGKLLMKIRRGL